MPTLQELQQRGKINIIKPIQQPETQQKKSKIGGFIKGVGKGIVSTLTGATSLAEKVGEKITGIETTSGGTLAERFVPERFRTPTGTAEKIGFGAEQIAEFFIPAGAITKAGKVGGLGTKIAAKGTELAGRTAIQEGEIGKETAIAGGIGAAFPVLGKAFGAVGNQIKGLPDRFIRSAIGRSKKEILADLSKDPNKTLSQFVLKTKKPKTANSLLEESRSEISRLGENVSNKLKSIKITEDKITVKNILDEVAKTAEATGALLKPNDIRKIIEKLAPQAKDLLQKPTMGIFNANKLRQTIDKALGDKAFISTQVGTNNREILKNVANILRNQVQTKVPETKPLFENLKFEIQLRDALGDKIAAKQGNQVLSFGDFIGGGLGGVFGGGAGGAVAGVAARRILESVPFKIGAAQSIEQLSKIGSIMSKLTPAEMGIISQLIQRNK